MEYVGGIQLFDFPLILALSDHPLQNSIELRFQFFSGHFLLTFFTPRASRDCDQTETRENNTTQAYHENALHD